jgi:hypothetical protein
MNRLTQHIGLVLISSSLILHGCVRAPDEEKKDQLSPGFHGVHSYPGVGRTPSGSQTGVTPGAQPSSTGSVRGGFGASSQGVTS